jgi:DNA-binding MarR family transcriptional regulator
MARQDQSRPSGEDVEAVAQDLADLVPRLYRLLRTALDEERWAPSLEQLRVMQRIDQGLHNVSALAAARQMRMSAITSILDILVERGWVTREPDRVDRRRIQVELTAPGRQALRRGRQLTVRRMTDILGHGRTAPGLHASVKLLVGAVDRYDLGPELRAG